MSKGQHTQGSAHGESATRTWLCTVVFLDIVAYSKHPVDEQLTMKEHFNRVVAAAIEHVQEKDRIILDTGDGAALCFLGDPEHALFAAINVRNAIASGEQNPGPAYLVRIGVNLGPVKLIKDVNGRQNAVGDGINSAQRIMSFAGDNRILVSRSYYEVISCLGEDFKHLFTYQGTRSDKHVREHTVYEVQTDQDVQEQGLARNTSDAVLTTVLPDASLDDGAVSRIQHALAEQIGPLAQTLVKRCAKNAASEAELCSELLKLLPDQDGLEELLTGVCGNGGVSNVEAAAEPGVGVVDQQAANLFSQELLDRMQQSLAMELGPLAKLLVKKAARIASDEKDLANRLANELPDEAARQRFLKGSQV